MIYRGAIIIFLVFFEFGMNILGFGDCDGILMGPGFVGSLTTHSYLYVRRRCVEFGLSSFFIIIAFMADEEDSLSIIKLKTGFLIKSIDCFNKYIKISVYHTLNLYNLTIIKLT